MRSVAQLWRTARRKGVRQLSSDASPVAAATPKAASYGTGAKRMVMDKTGKLVDLDKMSPEEIAGALPGMLFTGSNLFLCTLLAVGVAGVGLIGTVQISGYINDWADRRKARSQALLPPPPPPRSLRELILARKAELDAELVELRAAEPSQEVKQRIAEVRQELAHYRPSGSWLGWWS